MKNLLDKLSSYNIFNYLLPGVVFVLIAEKITSLALVQKDLVHGVFLYYFIGLIISRIGSLLIEPFLKKIRFLKFAVYADFVIASKKDDKLETLSESNNMYRTFCSLFFLIIVIKGYDFLSVKLPVFVNWHSEITLALLFFLFLFAYKKQTKYITDRIKATLKRSDNNG